MFNKACASRVRCGLVLYQNPLILNSCKLASRETRRNRNKGVKTVFLQLITTASLNLPTFFTTLALGNILDVVTFEVLKESVNENSVLQTTTTAYWFSCRK